MNFREQKQKDRQTEPLLDESHRRFTLFPIQYKEVFDDYKTLLSAFWVAEDITLTQDRTDFMTKLSKDEKHYLTRILAFFASADTLVNLNLMGTFMAEFTPPEVQAFFSAQACQETIHSECYSLMIDMLVSDPDEKSSLFDALENDPVIKRKGEWAMKWSSMDLPIAKRLVAWACVEGLLFASSFAGIAYFKDQGLLPGIGQANEYISRDESLHCRFAAHTLYNKLIVNKLSHEEVYEIVDEAVRVEDDFIDSALPVKMIGMNSSDMRSYIRFTANRLLQMLGVPPLYKNARCPWSFVSLISIEGASNFFEKRSADYAKSNLQRISGTIDVSDDDF